MLWLSKSYLVILYKNNEVQLPLSYNLHKFEFEFSQSTTYYAHNKYIKRKMIDFIFI